MTNIPHILHFVTPDHPNAVAVQRMERIKALHPGWQFFDWTDNHAPVGRLAAYYNKARSGAQVADLMRLDAVCTYGGVYVDSDFEIHRCLAPLADAYRFFIASEDGEYLTNALFGATPGHAALDAIVRSLIEHEPDWTLPPNRTTGPHLFKRICQWRSDVDVVPRETFYPFAWDAPPRAAHRLAYGTHLCEGSWLPEDLKRKPRGTSHVSSVKPLIRRAQIEASKLLSTIGLKGAGAALWNKAYGIEDAQGATTDRPPVQSSGSYTVGDEIFVRTRHGPILICDGHDVSITPHLALRGYYEWAEEMFLKRTLSGGDWFVDVGANIGNHAILAATCVEAFGRVFSFEPNARCSGLMRKSAVLNWVHDRLRIEELGVSDRVGEASLSFSAGLLGGAAIQTADPANSCFDATLAAMGDARTMTIPTTTLDIAFPADVPIRILKIDAEGHEPAILRGASRLLSSRSVDFVLLESIMELSATTWQENLAAYKTLIDFGYAAARLTSDGTLVRHASLQAALQDDASRTLVFHVP